MTGFDVNEFRGIEPIEPSPAAVAMRELYRIKASTKRTAFIAQKLVELPTQADVTEFTRLVRIDAKVQDIGLLPETTWTLTRGGKGRDIGNAGTVDTAELNAILADRAAMHIDWPSVTFHWGIIVRFDNEGIEFTARSADYELTETYMSS